jgi:AcrR family transcriptional regulator
MPKLWNETIEAHRREVREATLDATAALVAKHGLRSVTMSQIAEQTGIGRATLYKYFSDVEAILVAWHERHVTGHLEHLAEVRDRGGDAGSGLRPCSGLCAHFARAPRHRTRGTPAPGRARHPSAATAQQLRRNLVTEGAKTGHFRDDVAPAELASYPLHALSAASSLPSRPRSIGSSRSLWQVAPRADFVPMTLEPEVPNWKRTAGSR